jgi:hypothetical protein
VDDESERYKRYVVRQWFRGKHARSLENWRRESTRRSRAREFGNTFRDGMVHLLGRTQEQGWKTEVYRQTELGARFDDAANVKISHAMEFKSGKVGRDALLQLDKDAYGMRRGMTVEWYLAPTAKPTAEVTAKMQELEQKYPTRFRVMVVTREQFAQAIRIGRELARQREAQEVQKARENEMTQNIVAAKQVETKKADLRKQVGLQARLVNEARERGQAIEVDPLREAHAKMREALEQIREAERAQTREMLKAAGHTPQQIQAIETTLDQGRENQRKDLTRGIDAIGATVASADKVRAEREAAEQARQTERADREAADKERAEHLTRLQRQGIPAEVVKILGVGQAQAPSAAAHRDPNNPAPQVVRGGRSGPGLSRGIARDP